MKLYQLVNLLKMVDNRPAGIGKFARKIIPSKDVEEIRQLYQAAYQQVSNALRVKSADSTEIESPEDLAAEINLAEIPTEIAKKLIPISMRFSDYREGSLTKEVLRKLYWSLIADEHQKENEALPPDEVFLPIFNHLKPKDLIAISQTCTKFRAIASDSAFAKKLPFNYLSVKNEVVIGIPNIISAIVLANGVCLLINADYIYSFKKGKVVEHYPCNKGQTREGVEEYHRCLLALSDEGKFIEKATELKDKPLPGTIERASTFPIKVYPNHFLFYKGLARSQLRSMISGELTEPTRDSTILCQTYSKNFDLAEVQGGIDYEYYLHIKWNNKKEKYITIEKTNRFAYYNIQFLDSNSIIITTHQKVSLLNLITEQAKIIISAKGYYYHLPDISPDGNYIAVAKTDKKLKHSVEIYEVKNFTLINSFSVSEQVSNINFTCPESLTITTANSLTTIEFNQHTFSPISRLML